LKLIFLRYLKDLLFLVDNLSPAGNKLSVYWN